MWGYAGSCSRPCGCLYKEFSPQYIYISVDKYTYAYDSTRKDLYKHIRIYMYICMCPYIQKYTHICTCTYRPVYLYTCIHIYMYFYKHLPLHTHACMCVCKYVSTYTHIYAKIHKYIFHVHRYTCAYVHMYIYTDILAAKFVMYTHSISTCRSKYTYS